MPDCPCHPSPRPLTRRQVLVGGAAATGALALTGLPVGAAAEGDMVPIVSRGTPRAIHPDGDGGVTRAWSDVHPRSEKHVRPIMHPIAGTNTSLDNYRISSRPTHEGVDVMANKMVKLLACVSGTVVELRHRATPSGSSMNSLYIKGDDGWHYCYLHINNDQPSTDDGRNRVDQAWGPALRTYATSATAMNEVAARGHRVRKGEHIAYIGDSGNAENAGSHLHFEIRLPAGSLWDAAAVNPQYSLDAAEPAREIASVPPETFTPWDNARAFVTRQYRDLLGRTPGDEELGYWVDRLNSGEWTPQQFMEFMLIGGECDEKVHAVTRLYQAYFLRLPDQDGFGYWVGRRREGTTLAWISNFFASSSEFGSRYGSLDDARFVDRVYQNVLGREPDAAGRQFWLDKLRAGSTRGWVMTQFSESPENRSATRRPAHIVGAHGCMLRRMPMPEEILTWTPHTNIDMLHMMRMGTEYAQVVATTP